MKNIIECTSSELDFFSDQPYQNMINNGIFSVFNAINPTNKQIDFDIPPSPQYYDLSKSSVVLLLKITNGKGEELKDSDVVGPVNNFFHSLIKQAEIKINDVSVENTNSNYALKAYFADTLNHGIDAKNTFLQNSLYYHDTAGQMDNITLQKAPTKIEELLSPQVLNEGFIKRREILLKNKGEIQVRGIPHCDLFTNGKFILNQTKFSLHLILHDTSFFLIGSGDFNISIISANLWMKRVTPNDIIQNNVALQLEKKFAIYNTNSVKVIVKKLDQKGLSQKIVLSDGVIPKRIIVAMADYQSITLGKLEKNPYNFEHFDLKSFELKENEVLIPYSSALKFDFKKNQYLDGYWTLFDGIEKPFIGNNISREDYAKGYMFLAFDLTPNGECEPFKNIPRNGQITAELEWSSISDIQLGIIVYMETNDTFGIDKERNIITKKLL